MLNSCGCGGGIQASTFITIKFVRPPRLPVPGEDADAINATGATSDSVEITLDLVRRHGQPGCAGYLAQLNAEQAYNQSSEQILRRLVLALRKRFWQGGALPMLMRLLVVEDDVKTARALAAGLERGGFSVATAHTGEDGFFLLNAWWQRRPLRVRFAVGNAGIDSMSLSLCTP